MINTISNPKTAVIDQIDAVLIQCEKDINSFIENFKDDFLDYFVVKSKTHVICVMKQKQFLQLKEWIVVEEDTGKIVQLLQGGIDFMQRTLLNYRRIQSTNEMHNLKEEYKLEMFSQLIPLYERMLNMCK